MTVNEKRSLVNSGYISIQILHDVSLKRKLKTHFYCRQLTCSNTINDSTQSHVTKSNSYQWQCNGLTVIKCSSVGAAYLKTCHLLTTCFAFKRWHTSRVAKNNFLDMGGSGISWSTLNDQFELYWLLVKYPMLQHHVRIINKILLHFARKQVFFAQYHYYANGV